MNSTALTLWLSAPTGCPPPEAFAAASSGESSPELVARLTAHAAICPLCEVERDLAQSFLRPKQSELEKADVAFVVAQLGERLPRSIPALSQPATNVLTFRTERKASRPAGASSRGWKWQRLAAAALLALGLGLGYRAWRPAELPDSSDSGAIRGGQLEARAPAGELESLPERWSWTPHDGAAKYRVRLLAVDDTQLWQGESTRPEIVPGERVATLVRAAVRYRWTVTALDAAGRVLAESPEAWFRLRPKAY